MDATQDQLAKENAILQARCHKLEANAHALEREIEQLRQLVVNADAVSRSRFEYYGLCDCIDNAGGPYPSQWAADLIERASTTTEPTESLQRWAG